ncbi:hypothetical protein JCM17844_24540 [Iodidimonas gelatinilytica]|uniref:Uncharacterized protein n=1 Tax=Iodidimonas gelatinilytica TaxID=1236966 RepID=A0A5A7MZ59_9PROT|nr:hypothetical protein [Iodidimonas gelatinilytica]GEQ98817.1 hypothetical protein JCM17844_24540 [Iodidimonas gelatinilytica]GER01351.1 hypothetical protein JCM17845_19740 [Iodidimonas gelatinilytica]
MVNALMEKEKGRKKTPSVDHDNESVDEALDETFPASDPASYSTPHRSEPPIGKKKQK